MTESEKGAVMLCEGKSTMHTNSLMLRLQIYVNAIHKAA